MFFFKMFSKIAGPRGEYCNTIIAFDSSFGHRDAALSDIFLLEQLARRFCAHFILIWPQIRCKLFARTLVLIVRLSISFLDISFHFNVRFDEKHIIRNSLINNGKFELAIVSV